jgi:heptosyltransferase-2
MPEKILIVGPAWVGDMVMAQTLFIRLRQQFPDAQIDVLAPDWTRALLDRMPEVSQALSMPLGHGQLQLKTRWKLGRVLAKQNYTRAYVLPNSFKSALVPFFAGIAQRIGWRGEMRYGLLNQIHLLDKAKLPLMIERFMALSLAKDETLAKPYPFPKLIVDKASLAKAMENYQLKQDKPILAICPGAAFGPSKRWPAEYFAEVAKAKLAEGYQVWLFGSAADQPLTEKIQALTEQACLDFAGKTSLAEAIDLLSLAKVVVTNDSGLMHISAALGRPIVAVYGSTSTEFTPPLSEQVKVLNLNLDCSPCFKRECPLGHWRCMKDLKPAMVLSAIDELLS